MPSLVGSEMCIRDRFTPRPADAALRERLGFTPGTFVVTFAGTIGMASGLEVALGAARRLKEQGRDDIAFLLIGDGAVRADLESQARAQGLDNVAFTGLVPVSYTHLRAHETRH